MAGGFSSTVTVNSTDPGESANDYYPSLAVSESGTLVCAWVLDPDPQNPLPIDSDIAISRSVDGGVTWSAMVVPNPNAPSNFSSLYPQVATDQSGTWIVVWSSTDDLNATIGNDGDILYSRSVDDGVTWSAPTLLNTDGASDAANDKYPSIAADRDGNWVVTWATSGGIWGYDLDIVVARSVDGGVSWSSPQLLNADGPTDTYQNETVRVATDGNGTWIAGVVRQDVTPYPVWELYVRRSTDAGLTWSDPQFITNTGSIYGEDHYRPSLASDDAGGWIVVWCGEVYLPTPPAELGVYGSRSIDGGVTWSNVIRIWSGGSMGFGPASVATDRKGNWSTAWNRYVDGDADNYFAQSVDRGGSWGPAQVLNTDAETPADVSDYPPSIASSSSSGVVAVWQRSSGPYDLDVVAASEFPSPSMPIRSLYLVAPLMLIALWAMRRVATGNTGNHEK